LPVCNMAQVEARNKAPGRPKTAVLRLDVL
jgi:hypothetical protein